MKPFAPCEGGIGMAAMRTVRPGQVVSSGISRVRLNWLRFCWNFFVICHPGERKVVGRIKLNTVERLKSTELQVCPAHGAQGSGGALFFHHPKPERLVVESTR